MGSNIYYSFNFVEILALKVQKLSAKLKPLLEVIHSWHCPLEDFTPWIFLNLDSDCTVYSVYSVQCILYNMRLFGGVRKGGKNEERSALPPHSALTFNNFRQRSLLFIYLNRRTENYCCTATIGQIIIFNKWRIVTK